MFVCVCGDVRATKQMCCGRQIAATVRWCTRLSWWIMDRAAGLAKGFVAAPSYLFGFYLFHRDTKWHALRETETTEPCSHNKIGLTALYHHHHHHKHMHLKSMLLKCERFAFTLAEPIGHLVIITMIEHYTDRAGAGVYWEWRWEKPRPRLCDGRLGYAASSGHSSRWLWDLQPKDNCSSAHNLTYLSYGNQRRTNVFSSLCSFCYYLN